MFNSTYGWGIMCSNVGTSRRHPVHLASVVLLCLLQLQFSASLPLDQLYPFNANLTNGDLRTETTDDGSSPLITLPIDFPFFNKSDYRKLYVNNNGFISFELMTDMYKPLNFADKAFVATAPFISPFWADIDIKNVAGLDESVVYRIVTNDSEVLSRATWDVRKNFIGLNTFSAELVIIVTWYKVGYYGATGTGKDKRNTFQAVLITDGIKSFAIFNYEKIVWTTGSNSAGEVETGLGGDPAVVGFQSERNGSYYLLNNSGTDAILNITEGTNVDQAGQYMFRIDGEEINDLECAVDDTILLTPDSVSMLGGTAISVTGPCFHKDVPVKARILETGQEFPCAVTSDNSCVCGTPSIFRTGPLTFELNPHGENWTYTAAISSEHLLSIPVTLTRDKPETWVERKMVTARWDAAVNVPSNKTKTLDVMAYTNEANVPSFVSVLSRPVEVAAEKRSRKFKLPSYLSQHKSLVIKLCWTIDSNSRTLPACIWSDVFPVRWNQRNSKESEEWCENWLNEEQALLPIDIKAPFCPCVMNVAVKDFGHFHADPNCDISKHTVNTNCLYNSNAHQCFRRNIRSAEDSGETCCYTRIGELMDIREYSGAGTHQRYHYKAQGETIVPYFSYFESDLLPKLHCCQFSDRHCSDFKSFRKPTTCFGYAPPSAAQAAGDPHIVTLDGKGYSFNGVGDFYLVRHVDSTIAIQVRAVRARDENGDLQKATVFSHVAVTMPDSSDVIEVRKTDHGSEVLVNRRTITSSTSQFRNISFKHNDDGSHVILLEPVSVSVTVSVTPDLLNIIVLIGEDSLKGNIRGLLGNYNGKSDDDFIPRDGATLSSSASERQIHYDFGMTWQVPQEESILSQEMPTPVQAEPYEPMFIDEAAESSRPDMDIVCGNNVQCRFDYEITGKQSIAKATAEFTNKFEALKKELDQIVIRCPYLEIPVNGNKSVSGNSNGSEALFTCLPGYDMTLGSKRRVCQEDSTWSGSDVVCAIKTTDNSGTSIIVIAVASGSGSLVLLAIIVSVVFYCRQSREPKPDDDDLPELELPTFEPPPINLPGPVFENPSFMQSLQVLFKDGMFKIPRPNYVDPNIYQEYF